MTRNLRRMAIASTLVALAANAASIDFDKNPITFTPPAPGPGNTGTVGVTMSGPMLVGLPDGLSVQEFSYTLTLTGLGVIEELWKAERNFDLSDDSDVPVHIFGTTQVKLQGQGEVLFGVNGTLDGAVVTSFLSDPIKGGTKTLTWDKTAKQKAVKKGPHTLDEESGVLWKGGQIGDKLTVTSEYTVDTVDTSIPEPATAWLAGLGLVFMRAWSKALRQARLAITS